AGCGNGTMARLNGHRQTKGTETDKPIPTATAPHLDSTPAYFISSWLALEQSGGGEISPPRSHGSGRESFPSSGYYHPAARLTKRFYLIL
ncbi:MAG: hypothetical protein ABSE05_16765, partial [Syntrophales bacterium]